VGCRPRDANGKKRGRELGRMGGGGIAERRSGKEGGGGE